jgi:hypothetical protein
MRRIATASLPAVLAATLLLTAPADARLPRDFFGIVPQTELTAADTNRMRGGGIRTVRMPVTWPSVQATARAEFDWSGYDRIVSLLARSRLELVPVLYGTPRWAAGRETNLPISGPRQRQGWTAFVRAAVQRYGTRGDFWREHNRASGDFVPRTPVRTWQIWNEMNFFYFTTPASPSRYARLLRLTRPAVKGTDNRATIVLGGLFGEPRPRPPRAMNSATFLNRLYRSRGIRHTFDGVALHPYAANAAALRRMTGRIRRVVVANRDRRAGLYITEMGWGSQRNPRRVAFEVGLRPQARELRRAYSYLIRNRRRLNLRQVHWFSWKDVAGSCNFCDSVGLFRRGQRFRPKPAWHTFVAITRGRLR